MMLKLFIFHDQIVSKFLTNLKAKCNESQKVREQRVIYQHLPQHILLSNLIIFLKITLRQFYEVSGK